VKEALVSRFLTPGSRRRVQQKNILSSIFRLAHGRSQCRAPPPRARPPLLCTFLKDLNVRKMYKLWKLLHMKTSHMMSIFGDIPLNRSEKHSKNGFLCLLALWKVNYFT